MQIQKKVVVMTDLTGSYVALQSISYLEGYTPQIIYKE